MAHFAQLDNDNIVLTIFVFNNEDILDSNDSESEEVGIDFCKELFGADTIWVKTSYNNVFRKQFATPDGTYDVAANEFVNPSPYPSWSLDANNDWQAPVGYPEMVTPILGMKKHYLGTCHKRIKRRFLLQLMVRL